MNWQYLFRPHILDRGLNYYYENRVQDYYEEDDYIYARVYGSEAYDVSIAFEDGKVVDMECECPYANDGNHCKHMAAVLYYREFLEEGEPVTVEKQEDLKDIVYEAKEEDVRAFLVDELKSDADLARRFRRYIGMPLSQEDIVAYIRYIDNLFYTHSDRYGNIPYSEASYVSDELSSFLRREAESLIEGKQYEGAFDLSTYVFEKVASDFADSEIDSGWVAHVCVDIWHNIAELCDISLKKRMFATMQNYLYQVFDEDMKEYAENFLFESFSEKQFLADKAELVDEMIKLYASAKDKWPAEYVLETWFVRKLNIMKQMHIPQTQIEAFIKENIRFESVRETYVDSCIEKGEYEKAIQVLIEGRDDKTLSHFQVTNFSTRLKDLYKELGKDKEYENELWTLMMEFRAGDLDMYKELKSLYTPLEWPIKREKIFFKYQSSFFLGEMYAEDKLYDRLIEYVTIQRGLSELQKYESCLKDEYSEMLLEKYAKEVDLMAQNASNRSQYRTLASILKHMQTLPNSKECVNTILLQFRAQYKRRSAMMDELDAL